MTLNRQAHQAALEEVRIELIKARMKFQPMRGPHEGYAVIKEEVDELWDDIKANRSGKQEATQVAAMAIAYMIEIGDDPQ